MTERDAIDCPNCNGLGLVRGQYAQHKRAFECPQCKGWGWVYQNEPERIAGTSYVCAVPEALGAVTKLEVKRGRVIARTESGQTMIVPVAGDGETAPKQEGR